MSSAAVGQTLQFITDVKLEELEKHRLAFEKHASAVLKEASHHDAHPVKKAAVLVKGIRSWPGTWSSEGNLNLDNISDWLHQAERDPGFSTHLVQSWCRRLEARIRHESTQFEYARLFGRLLTQWLQSAKPITKDGDNASVGGSDDFETVSRQETMDQQTKLESLIFQTKEINEPALKSYLEDLFSGEEESAALNTMRERLSKFGETLRRTQITPEDVEWCIRSLLSTDLLSDEKQATLKEFSANPVVVKELASVLNMQMATLPSWSWPKDGVSVDPRRHLNGKVRFYLDYEVLTALLLQYLGMKWSMEMKATLSEFYGSVWKDTTTSLSKTERTRGDVFRVPSGHNRSGMSGRGRVRGRGRGGPNRARFLGATRREYHNQKIFMCQMPSSTDAKSPYNDHMDEKEDKDKSENPMDLKQSLLHFLQADTMITRAVHGECTIVRTDLQWFGPSLAHQTILIVLEFLGVPPPDLNFMRSFLACPLQFTGTTREYLANPAAYKKHPAESPRVRKRGTPIAHALSVLCGEAVMFVMDFAVNKRADGLSLYRIHDDFWFWNSDAGRCARAWAEMNKFADLAGLKFNEEKTGSIQIGEKPVPHQGLPGGAIKWGLLTMDAHDEGKFKIDGTAVEEHIVEFQRQLRSTNSVFSWSQAYNKYMAFFIRNFGTPAVVNGRAHVDSIVDSLAEIQKGMFPESGGSLITTLAKTMEREFGMKGVPSGWYFWPTGAGGLEIVDPMVDLLVVRNSLSRPASLIIEEAFQNERDDYEAGKKNWETGERDRWHVSNPVVPDDAPFFPFDEYAKGREDEAYHWGIALNELLEVPEPQAVEVTPEITAAIEVLGDGLEAFRSKEGWERLSPYWKWILSLHHGEMVAKFGSLAIVDPASIPVGMVSVFKTSRMRWEQ